MKKPFGTFNVVLQQPNFRQYTFTHFNSTNGLASNLVNTVVQDNEGYIWMATLDGLQRYDGNRFLTFRHQSKNRNSIPGSNVNSIFLDGAGNLWVLAENRLGIFDRHRFSFREIAINPDSSGKGKSVRFVRLDAAKNIIAYVDQKGLYLYDRKIGNFALNLALELPSDWWISDIMKAPVANDYWIACNPGFVYYNSKTGNFNYKGHNPDQNPHIKALEKEGMLNSIFGLYNDTLWYGSWPQMDGAPFINSFSLKSDKLTRYSVGQQFDLGYFEVGGAIRQSNGRMWFYGRTFLAEFVGGETPFRLVRNEFKDEQSIKFDIVTSLYEDRQQNLWVSTENGAFLFNPDAQPFNSHLMLRPDGSGSLDGPSVAALELADKSHLIGAWGSGLYKFDSNFNPVPLPPQLDRFHAPYAFWSLIQDRNTGLVWMGMQDGGLVVYNPQTGKADLFYFGHIRSTIRQLAQDLDGNIWLGCQGGHILKYQAGSDFSKQSSYELVRKRDGALVQKLFVDKDGFVWAGTLTDGLFKFDPKSSRQLAHITKYGEKGKSMWNNSPCDILQYNDSTLLIAGGALNLLNVRTLDIKIVAAEDGMPSNTVLCFQRDNSGHLWLGMSHGLYRADLKRKIFSQYDRRDGINYDNFNVASAFRMKNGRLVFTTDHSFTEFNPSTIPNPPRPGNAVITAFRLANNFLSVDSLRSLNRLQLKHDNTSIAIEFSSLNYVKQNKIHYHYMLEGVDK
ncbi:MAG: hypothetical protein H7Y27_07925, partial [Gemmatimonadaceae bacterium]|nr:hypothetical protein [Chitinophagaceae bacterium]